jgi:DNA-binding transcriptional regulator YdaS (Cro superfamily)
VTGDTPRPDWVEALLDAVKQLGSQKAVADLLGYSPATISLVLSGRHPNPATIEQIVRGRFMATTVDCPLVGELPVDQCTRHQQAPWSPHNPQRIAFYKACRGGGCPHSRVGGTR